MLSYQKNKLINLLLKFEIAFNEISHEIDKKTNKMALNGEFSKASDYSFINDIINRNLQSIKAQLKKI